MAIKINNSTIFNVTQIELLQLFFMKMEISKEEFYHYLEGIAQIAISDDTQIFKDFGWEGLDTDTFMIQCGKTFNLDLSSYNHDKYDDGDSSLIKFIGDIYLRVFNRQKYRETRIQTFSALHLFNVVKKGKWFNP
jgi:hypothetical protein